MLETPDKFPVQIVIAEDNPADVKLVRMALRDAGLDCSLRVVGDGAQAIALIETLDADSKAAPIDLLLLDMHMPKYDGEDVLKRLRSTERHAQTPVIVMTTSNAPQDHEKALKNAAVYYFMKPSSVKEFLQLGEIILDILSRRTGGRAQDRQGAR